MTTLLTTVQGAGAQESCAEFQQTGFAPVLRRDLLRAIRKVRTSLGLSTGDVLVIDTLLSFLPCRDRRTRAELHVTSEMMLIIYASNAAICERANGMSERVLRRHIARLAAAGLVERKDSATGKRFPLKSGGKVRTAYGIDLRPLLTQADQILELARMIEQEAEEIRALRAQALAMRAEKLRSASTLSPEALSFVEAVKTILRRASLTAHCVRDLIARMSSITGETAAPAASTETNDVKRRDQTSASGHVDRGQAVNTEKKSGADGQRVRQVESKKIDTDIPRDTEIGSPDQFWEGCPNIVSFFPDAPRSTTEFRETVYLLGRFIALSEQTLAQAIASIGWHGTLTAMDYLIGHAGKIKNPDGYMMRMVQNHRISEPLAYE